MPLGKLGLRNIHLIYFDLGIAEVVVCVCMCMFKSKMGSSFWECILPLFPCSHCGDVWLTGTGRSAPCQIFIRSLKTMDLQAVHFLSKKKNPILITLQPQSKSGLQVTCDVGTRQMNLVILWFSFSFLKLRKNRKSTFGFYMPWSFIITKIFTHNFCKFSFLSVWHRPRNSRQYLSY